MTDLATPPRPVTVEPDNTLDELATSIAFLNATAKLMSRRGKAFDDASYAEWHQRINQAISDYELKAHAHSA